MLDTLILRIFVETGYVLNTDNVWGKLTDTTAKLKYSSIWDATIISIKVKVLK